MIKLERLTFGASAHPQGHYAFAKGLAAGHWRTLPERPAIDGLVIVETGGEYPEYRRYYDGRFRNKNGNAVADPPAWAYYLERGAEPTPLPDHRMVPTDDVQAAADIIMQLYRWDDFWAAVDASPFVTGRPGAPE